MSTDDGRRYMPTYHFFDDVSFINDPNGLVYFQGEYHLFYQRRPLNVKADGISWGHAFSRDLVHWEGLPVAIPAADGYSIWSGSCVVDWQNSSGLGRGSEPPLVAFYTAFRHSDRLQRQDMAFSTDRGRTWTKFAGNPVLDIGSRAFRDPKVLWHAPTKSWIMAVVLADEKEVCYYRSADLKQWAHLSNFGPCGAPKKPNWECPDLFELPVENEPGQSRWVQHVGIGDNSVAGGSGGEYFIGRFDGSAFHNDNPPETVLWADHGHDFYAAVTWSDIPKENGRRLWLGWMSAWQYASTIPTTERWKGMQSAPREIALRRIDGQLRLIQRPVKELQVLRGEHQSHAALTLTPSAPLDQQNVLSGDALEIVAEFEPGDAKEFGLKVRCGAQEETVIGYDAAARQMFVDRTRSGEVQFSPRFPGRHTAPLRPRDQRIKLHVLVDRSSVEVFGNDGENTITDLIFPDPKSGGVQAYALGGKATLAKLDVWRLAM